jgi:hypothetical protein
VSELKVDDGMKKNNTQALTSNDEIDLVPSTIEVETNKMFRTERVSLSAEPLEPTSENIERLLMALEKRNESSVNWRESYRRTAYSVLKNLGYEEVESKWREIQSDEFSQLLVWTLELLTQLEQLELEEELGKAHESANIARACAEYFMRIVLSGFSVDVQRSLRWKGSGSVGGKSKNKSFTAARLNIMRDYIRKYPNDTLENLANEIHNRRGFKRFNFDSIRIKLGELRREISCKEGPSIHGGESS